jgi:hypothetical protein
MTVATSTTIPHREFQGARRNPPPGTASLAAIIDALALMRATFHGRCTRLIQGGLIAIATFIGWWALDHFTTRQLSDREQAFESRALELATHALLPGSALPCLDAIAGDVVEGACEKAIFASPEATAAAVSYVAAQLSLLVSTSDHAGRTAPSLRTAQLRRAIETDRFGIAAHVLAVSGGCAPDHCTALALLHDARRVSKNLAERPFNALVELYSAGWPAGSNRPAASNSPRAAAEATPEAGPKSVSNLYFPSSSSIPPINIMTAEPAVSPSHGTARTNAAIAPPGKPMPSSPQMRQAANPKAASAR